MKKCCNPLRLRAGVGVDVNLSTPTPTPFKTTDSGSDSDSDSAALIDRAVFVLSSISNQHNIASLMHF